MYAPLALTFVYDHRLFIRCLTHYPLRAPVVPIIANATATATASSSSHTGAIAGVIAGGVAALILVAGTIAFVRRRRRQDGFRKSAGSSFSSAAMEAGSQMTVMPFNPTLAVAAPLEAGSRSRTASDGRSSTSGPSLPPSQSVAPVPVGLTSKELAQLRSAAMRSPPTTHPWSSSSGSPPSQSVAPVPVGLTGKELARLRSAALRSPPTTHARTSSSESHPPIISTAEGSTSTPAPETRRLQSEVESLRREMQELRAERFEAPPSYGAGGGV